MSKTRCLVSDEINLASQKKHSIISESDNPFYFSESTEIYLAATMYFVA